MPPRILTTDYAFASGAPGARNRYLPERLTDAVNFGDFGPDPTGSADCWEKFMDAIHAARNAAGVSVAISIGRADSDVKASGTIFIPRGRYYVSKDVELIYALNALGNTFGVSFHFLGDSAGSTVIVGGHNGFILSSGGTAGMRGTFIVEHLTVINENRTPLTSGAVFNGGCESATRNCIVSGMVGLAMQSNTAWDGGCHNVTFLGPGFGINSLGLSQSCDGSVAVGCYFTGWDTAHIVGQDTAHVAGCTYEKNRLALDLGGIQTAIPGRTFASNPMSSFGSGGIATFSILGCRFKSNGTSIATTDGHIDTPATGNMGSGLIAGFHIDCTPADGISDSGNVQYGVHINGVGVVANGLVEGGPIDHYAYKMANAGAMEYWGLQCGADVPYAKRFSFPSGYGEARNHELRYCGSAPAWTYSDLPWATFDSAAIHGTTLTYTENFIRNGFHFYQYDLRWVYGPGVLPATRATSQGTVFNNALIDAGDGTGAVGNTIRFETYTGPDPAVGGLIQILGDMGSEINSILSIDDGSGNLTTPGNVMILGDRAILANATISNGSGGVGNILSWESVTGDPINNLYPLARVAIGINGAGGIPRDTWIVERLSTNSARINRSLNISAPIIYVLADIRPNYYISSITPQDSLGRSPPAGARLVTELSLWKWTLDTTALYGPSAGPALIFVPDRFFSRFLTDQVDANTWHFDGTPISMGPSNQFWLSNTWTVDKTQDTGAPQTLSFILDNPGRSYIIKDSQVPTWTGAVSNVGRLLPPTDSGGSNEVRVRFDERRGFVITG